MFQTRSLEGSGGRIEFAGSPIERYVRQVKVDAYGASATEGRPEFGVIELNYDIGAVFRTAIYIEAGSDVMFVKAK